MSDDETKSSTDEGASTASVRECDEVSQDYFVSSNPPNEEACYKSLGC